MVFGLRLGFGSKSLSAVLPLIDIASASLSGSTITIRLILPAGVTDFVPTTNIKNFAFFDTANAYPSGTRIPFSSVVRTDPSTITAILASAPATSGLLYSGAQNIDTVDPAQLVKGNDSNGTALLTKTMPLPFGVTGGRAFSSGFSSGFQ